MGSVQHKVKYAMHTKESVRTETSISHSILCALNTFTFYSVLVEVGRPVVSIQCKTLYLIGVRVFFG